MRKMTLKRKILITMLSLSMVLFFAMGMASFISKSNVSYGAETVPVSDLELNGENDIVIGNAKTNGVTTTGLTFATGITGTYKNHVRGTNEALNKDFVVVYQIASPFSAKYYDTLKLDLFTGGPINVSFYSPLDKVLSPGNSRRDADLKGGANTIYLNTKEFADENGMVKNITLRVNTGTNIQIFLDSAIAKLTKVTYHDTLTTNVVYNKYEDLTFGGEELNGIDYSSITPLKIQAEKGYHTAEPHFYIASSYGVCKANTGYAFTMLFNNAYKADLIRDLSMCVLLPDADWYLFSSDTSDIDITKAVVHTKGIAEKTFSFNAQNFADKNGYFSGITFYTPNINVQSSLFLGKMTVRLNKYETLTQDKQLKIIDVGSVNVWSGSEFTNNVTIPESSFIPYLTDRWNQANVGVHYGATFANNAFVVCFDRVKGDNVSQIRIKVATGGASDYYFFNSKTKVISPENAKAEYKGFSGSEFVLNAKDFVGDDGYISNITILKQGANIGVFMDSITFKYISSEQVTADKKVEFQFVNPSSVGVNTSFTVGNQFATNTYEKYTKGYNGVGIAGKPRPDNTVISLSFNKNYIVPLNYNLEFSMFSGIKQSKLYFFGSGAENTDLANALLVVDIAQYKDVPIKLSMIDFVDERGIFNNITVYIETAQPTNDGGQVWFSDIYLKEDSEAFSISGASVRINEPSGLGFGSKVKQEFYNQLINKYGEENIKTGTLITRSDFLINNSELTISHPKALIINNTGWKKTSEGYNLYRGSIVAIPEAKYETDFSGRGYIEINTGNKKLYCYTDVINRNISAVATNALNNPDETFTEEQKAILNKFAGGVIVDNGMTSYSAVRPVSATQTEINGANILCQYFNESSSANLAVVTESTPISKGIYIGNTTLGMNYTPAYADSEAYIITTDQNGNIIIRGNTDRGTLYGVYDFLEKYLNVDFIGNGLTNISPQKSVFFSEIVEESFVPSVKMRAYVTYETYPAGVIAPDYSMLKQNTFYAMKDGKFENVSSYGGVDLIGQYEMDHNSYNTLEEGVKIYNAEHGTNLKATDFAYNLPTVNKHEVCMTKTVNGVTSLELVTLGMKALIEKEYKFGTRYFAYQQEDSYMDGACTCSSCQDKRNEFGGASGQLIDFCNRMINNIEQDTDFMSKYPDFRIVTFSYAYTQDAPTVESVKCNDRLVLRMALSRADNFYGINDTSHNQSTATRIANWKNHLGKETMVWIYDSDFTNYAGYYPTLNRSIADNVKAMIDLKTVFGFINGSYNAPYDWDGQMRLYIYSKMMYNFDMDKYMADADAYVMELADEFIRGYFGNNNFAKMKQLIVNYQNLYKDNGGIIIGSSKSILESGLRQLNSTIDNIINAENDVAIKTRLKLVKISIMADLMDGGKLTTAEKTQLKSLAEECGFTQWSEGFKVADKL